MKIEEEIDQRSFPSEYIKAHINLMYTAGWAQRQIVKELKPYGISIQQFNILRILRGRAPRPASIRELTERMLDKSSNASRLVDKLCRKGLTEKQACPKDCRKLEVKITGKGLGLLVEASGKIEGATKILYQNISEKDARELNRILDCLRG